MQVSLYILKFKNVLHGQVAVQANDPTEAHCIMAEAWERKYRCSPSPVKSYEVIADEADTSGTWLVVVPRANPESAARIAELERKLAELTAEKDAAIAAEVKRAQKAERERDELSADLCNEVERKCDLKEQLRELTQAATPFLTPAAFQEIAHERREYLQAVLDAQRGEKEAKP